MGAQVGNIENLMFRIGFATSFLTGGPIDEDIAYLDLGALGQSQTTTTHEYSVQIIGGRALIVPHFELTDILSLYGGLGGGLFYAFGKSEIEAHTVTTTANATTTSNSSQSYEYENKVFPGLLSVLGMRFAIAGPLSAMAEFGYDVMNVTVEKQTHTANDGTITTTNYERDATDRQAPPKIPATNIALRAALVFSIMQ